MLSHAIHRKPVGNFMESHVLGKAADLMTNPTMWFL